MNMSHEVPNPRRNSRSKRQHIRRVEVIKRAMTPPIARRGSDSSLNIPARSAHGFDSRHFHGKVSSDGGSERATGAMRVPGIDMRAFDPSDVSVRSEEDVDDDISLLRRSGSDAVFLEGDVSTLDEHPPRTEGAELPRQIL